MTAYRHLLHLCLVLAIVVIGLGAYVRLSDAGLGCPDWPGCYGQLLGIPENAADPLRAAKEMAHRYLAGSLGCGILGLGLLAWRHRRQVSPTLPMLLIGVVAGQAGLGMLTVTQLLKPLVVSAHLLGGMTTLALLVWMQRSLRPASTASAPAGTQHWAILSLLFVAGQIALGAWVSSNYAALACAGFPQCNGAWLPAMDFAAAFELHRPLGMSADQPLLTQDALSAIQWTHRAGALIVMLLAGGFALRLLRLPGWHRQGSLLASLLLSQIGLGIASVLLARPLPLAVAHTLGATLLPAALLAIIHRLGHPAQLPCHRI